MSMPFARAASLCLFLIAALLNTHSRAAGDKELDAQLGFEDCSIGTGAAQLAAQCTTIAVPLDPLLESGDTLELSVARIPARRQSTLNDAFTLLAGGPGQSAIDSFPAISFAFRHIMKDRDVILIDQRGTGASAPLTCPSAPDSLGLEMDVDPDNLRQSAVECLNSLTYDPQLFTTSVAVRDLEFVRQALGVEQWNLYGISYGTRVAQHYVKQYADAVRTVTLDAVVPPSISLGPDIAHLAQRALDLIFERCSNSDGCNEAFGDLQSGTQTLLDALEQQPRTITFENVASGKLDSMVFTRQHLAITLRLMSYSAQTAAILPSMLHEAIVNDNLAPLARQANLQTRSLGDSLATGMHHAVICTEDAPFVVATDNDAAAEFSDKTSSSYLGDSIAASLLATCDAWPAGRIDENFKQPLVSDKPVLILSGEVDPITPPEYGTRAAEHLTRSRHIINADQGHMQAPFGCMPALLAHFIDTADAAALDTTCLERMRVLPFFVDANGPLP